MEDWEARRLDATIQTAALCAYVDGHLAREERERMCECIATYAQSEEDARRLLALAKELPEWVEAPPSGFRDSQIAEIKAALRNGDERNKAFELAVRVAHAHRGIGVHETSFLLNLMFELEIDPGHARKFISKVKAETRA